jgi:cell wall-associated NlpC family hydrolase
MAKRKRTQPTGLVLDAAPPGCALGLTPDRASGHSGGSGHRLSRPVAWSALITAAVLAVSVPIATAPAFAAPADSAGSTSQIPDVGARPVPAGALQLPGVAVGATTPVTGLSPLAAQITAGENEVSGLGEQLKAKGIQRQNARTNLAISDRGWREATDRLQTARKKADSAAESAFKSAAALPPGITSDLYGLQALTPAGGNGLGSNQASARDVLRAQKDEQTAYQAYTQQIKAEASLASEYLSLQNTFQQRQQALTELKARNSTQLAAVEREREAHEQALGASFVGNDTVAGTKANPKALAAVNVALAQLGKWYEWGAEGPNTFDCSGLMWYSYLHGAGYNLPRVAKDQFDGTRTSQVSETALLPGDLLFFSTNPNDWTAIHHVGMYIGNGKMVQAPTTGEKVKISTVWWSEFFGATRVFPAVAAPGGGTPTPTPSPTPTKKPSPTPTPTKTKSPTPTPTKPTLPPTTAPPTTAPPTTAPPTTAPPTTAPPTDAPASSTPSAGTSQSTPSTASSSASLPASSSSSAASATASASS